MNGRPRKITQKHIDLIDEYVLTIKDKWIKFEKSHSSGEKSSSESYEYKLDVKLPTYAGLLLFYKSIDKKLRIGKTTLFDWQALGNIENAEEIYKNFSNSLEDLLNLQEEMLVNGGVANKYGQVITKLMLNVNHGYKEVEKKEVEHTGTIDLGSFFDDTLNKKDKLVK